MRRHQGSFAIDADLLDQLDVEAERAGESRSEIVNQLLRDALERKHQEEFVTAGFEAGVGISTLVLFLVLAMILVV